VVLTGAFRGWLYSDPLVFTATGGVEDYDIFVARLDANFVPLWVRTGGSPEVPGCTSSSDSPGAVAMGPKGKRIYVTATVRQGTLSFPPDTIKNTHKDSTLAVWAL
jgi:hypothetical protein